jgi:hypothetical protein
MSIKRFLPAIAAFTLLGNVISIKAQPQSSPPDLSGRWILISGEPGASSPLGNEGLITQDRSAVTFQSLKVPFDGSTTTIQDVAYVWQCEGRWIGFAFVASMKASSGMTPANFTDLMVVSPTSAETMTMFLTRTSMSGKLTTTYTLKYRKT